MSNQENRLSKGFIRLDQVLAIIMAGGAGERLQPLTRGRSKSSVPFGRGEKWDQRKGVS